MSRIGVKPLKIEEGVNVEVSGKTVTVSGAKGTLCLDLPYTVTAEKKDGILSFSRRNDSKQAKSDHGTIRSVVENMIEGVVRGYKKDLELVGMGYRARVEGRTLILNVGLASPVRINIPEDLSVAVDKDVFVTISGTDKQRVGLWASKIRSVRKPEPYKGKGIKYTDEIVRRKTSKTIKEE